MPEYQSTPADPTEYLPAPDLTQWYLRDTDNRPGVLNPMGTYGLPVIHRVTVAKPCGNLHATMCFPINERTFMAMWHAELARVRMGLARTVEFCQKCTIVEKKVAPHD